MRERGPTKSKAALVSCSRLSMVLYLWVSGPDFPLTPHSTDLCSGFITPRECLDHTTILKSITLEACFPEKTTLEFCSAPLIQYKNTHMWFVPLYLKKVNR